MEVLSIFTSMLTKSWWLFALVLLIGLTKTSWFKGYAGEFIVKLICKFGLNKNQYHAFHDIMLATPDGTTQIDHILVSTYGLFVIETKNMKGGILGDSSQANWTQQIYKQKYSFQNPLRQNYKHTKALESLLGIPSEVIYSVIVFVGESTFKTAMPENVTYATGLISYIKSKNQRVLSDLQVKEIISAIDSGKLKASFQMRQEHVRNLKSRNDPNSSQRCPKCGSPMVIRTSKKGVSQGKQFWGCSQYPKCEMTRQIEEASA